MFQNPVPYNQLVFLLLPSTNLHTTNYVSIQRRRLLSVLKDSINIITQPNISICSVVLPGVNGGKMLMWKGTIQTPRTIEEKTAGHNVMLCIRKEDKLKYYIILYYYISASCFPRIE